MSPVTAGLLALLTVGFLVTEHVDASVLQKGEADILAVEEAERQSAETVKEEITRLAKGEQDCINGVDIICLETYFTDDVRTMLTGFPTTIGRAEAGAHIHLLNTVQGTLTVEEVLPTTSDASYVVSRLGLISHFLNGTVAYRGKAVQVWKKIGSDYKIYIDIFNRDY